MLAVMELEGLLLIDNQDAYTAYKAVVVEGGHTGLLQWPSLKGVETNDWHEYDGLEAELSNPILDSKEFPVDFYIFGEGQDGLDNLYALVDALRHGSFHTFNFAMVGKTVKLRVVSFGEPELNPGGLRISITFADDFPLSGYEYLEPASTVPSFEDYLFGEVPFTDYGIRIIEGSLKGAINMADVKQNLCRKISTVPGAIYDDPGEEEVEPGEPEPDRLVKLSFRELNLNCYLTAANLEEFWRNYNALLYDLTTPGEKVITSQNSGKDISCYYQSSEVESIFIDQDKITLKFSIKLKVVGENTYY